MRSNVVRSVAALVAVSTAALPVAARSSPNGLTPAQAQRLHRLGYAVVPNPVPPGFRVATVTVAPDSSSYRVVYVRNSDGATFTIAGARGGAASSAGVAASTPAPKKHGFLASLSTAIGGIGKKTSPQNASTSGESEESMREAGTVADSRVIGPTHFASDGACLKGVADSSKGMIHNASFTVQACNFEKTDPVVRAYRSVARV